jgi:type I restriction enzyme, S subunit
MNMQSIPLGSLAAVRSGGGAPQESTEFTATGHPFIRAGSLSKLLDGAHEEDLEKLEPTVAEKHGLTLFPSGTVLFAKSGMSATKGHIYRLRQPAYVVNHLAALVPHDPDDSAFLVRALQRFSPTVLIRDSAYPSLRLGDIEDMRVLAPDDSTDRRRIAEVLDRAEALRAKRRAALAQLDTLTQAIFLDLFGDPANNPKGWPRVELGELIATGPQNGLYKPSTDYGSGVPILRIDAFYDGEVTGLGALKRVRISDEERELYALHAGDIVVNRVNSMEYLGKSALIPQLDEPAVFESNMMRFEIDLTRVEPGYIVQFLQSRFVKGQILTAAKHAVNQSSVNQQDIKGFRINVPPIPLQQDFMRRVDAVRKVEAVQHASLTELDALFAALQHLAFRGEL